MHELTIRLDDMGDIARVALPDPRSEETIRDLLSRAGGVSVRIEPFEEDDTVGHAATDALEVVVRIEDDTEGHAMSLRFPTAGEARDFQRRLLATGAIAATIVVGAAAIQMTSQDAAQQAGAPAAGPAIVRQAPAVAPGLAGEIKGGEVAPSVSTPAVAPGLAGEVKGGQVAPSVATPTFDRGAAVHNAGNAVQAPTFDRGAAVHNAGKDTALPDGWQTSRRHFPQAAGTEAPSVAPGMAAEVKGGDVSGKSAGADAEAPAADEDAPQQDGGFFRGR
jgi:hypothetical protein